MQHRDEVDRAFAQRALGNIEGALRAADDLALQPLAQGTLLHGDQRTLDVGERRDHGLPVELQQLLLAAFLQIENAAQPAAVEDRLRQAGGDRCRRPTSGSTSVCSATLW